MYPIFISYARIDGGDFAAVLIQELRKHGFEHWIDSEYIPVGEDWPLKIDDALRSCFALILVKTQGAIESEYVTYEWSFALGRGIKFIPLLFKELDEGKVHPRLKTINHLNFTNALARPWHDLFTVLNQAHSEYVIHGNVIYKSTNYTPRFIENRLSELEKSSDNSARKRVIDNLAKSTDRTVWDTIAQLVAQHHLPDVRVYCAFKLCEKAEYHAKAIPGLLEAISGFDDDDRRVATRYLVQIGDEAIPGLLKILGSNMSESNYIAVSASARTLGGMKARIALPQLIKLLSNSDYRIRESAVEAIELINDSSVTKDLSEVLPTISEDVLQKRICRLMFKFGDYSMQPVLIGLLRSSSDFIRDDAVEMLIKIGDSVIPDVIEVLQDKTVHAVSRGSACAILGNLKNPSAIPALIAALDDDDGYVRGYAAKALGHMGVIEATDRIEKMLDDDDLNARNGAEHALHLLNTSESQAILKRWHLRKQLKQSSQL